MVTSTAGAATVVERRMHIETTSGSRRVSGPYYHTEIRYRDANGESIAWKGLIQASSPEEALRIFDRFRPGTEAPVLPTGQNYDEDPPVPDLYKLAIGAGLTLMALFFLLPILGAFGVESWWTRMARLPLIFGFGAMFGAGMLAFHMHTVLTKWPSVEARQEKSDPVALLDARAPEVTMNEATRKYLGSGYDVLRYTVNGVNYTYALRSNSVDPGCQRDQTCRILYNPASPTNIAKVEPLEPATFAGPIALAGMGLVFALAGLFF